MASATACAVMPNFLLTEYFVNFTERGDEISPNALKPENSYIPLPTIPGLGVDLDEDALARFPYREFPPRSLPTYRDERI